MIKKFEMKNIPVQLYPKGYVSIIPGMESLLDIPNYDANDGAKIAGISQMVNDNNERMSVIFVGERDEKLSIAESDMRVLLDRSCGFDVLKSDTELEKNKKLAKKEALKKVEALIPKRLDPKLRDFLLYNLHQNSLAQSPEKVMLIEILVRHYNSGFKRNDTSCCNPWKILIKIAKDGKSFSVTNIYREDYRQNNDEGILRRVDPTIVSSTVSFCIGSNGDIQANFDKISVQSSDGKLVNYFAQRVRQAVADQVEITYQPPERCTPQAAISPMEFLCNAKLEHIIAELSNNKKDSIHALRILIARIQEIKFSECSIEQLECLHKIFHLLEEYCHDALAENFNDEAACERAFCLHEIIVARFYPEILKTSQNDPIVLKMKISQEEIEKWIDKEHIPPEIVKKSLDRANLELINRMTSLAIPKTFKFEPVHPKPNWREIFQKSANIIPPKKEWAYKAFTTVGITLAVCFSVALVAGAIVGTGGIGAVPVIGTVIALMLSPPVALSVLGALVTSLIASAGFAWWHKKDVAACEKSSKEYIDEIEKKVEEIRKPIAQENPQLTVEPAQKRQEATASGNTALAVTTHSTPMLSLANNPLTLLGNTAPKSEPPRVAAANSLINKRIN